MCLVAPALDCVDNAALDVHQAPQVSECGKPWAELMNFPGFITAPPPNNPIPPPPPLALSQILASGKVFQGLGLFSYTSYGSETETE